MKGKVKHLKLDRNKEIVSYPEKYSVLFFIGIGLYVLTRALYWGIESNLAIPDSPLYATLANIMPLNIWAIPFAIAGILFMYAGITVIKQKTCYKFDISLVFGGLIAFVCHIILALLSVTDGINWMTPAMNCILAILFLSLAYLGVESLWKKKKEKKETKITM